MWRVVDELLRRRSRLVRGLVRPVAGPLRGTVVSSMSRERAGLTHAVVLFALALAFAASTAIFNATYLQQVGVDARLTNGADVLVTEPPSAHTSGDEAARLGAVSGVRRVEPMMHRFAYVGPDLQDLYGVRATTVGRVTRLQDAYFRGGSASSLMSALQHTPDGLLVSAETVHDFQLVLGDRLNLRLRDRNSGRLVPVSFRYLGVATEFPTAPHDSFLVANADYVAGRTQDLSYDTFLLDVGASSPGQVADRTRQLLGGTASVTDIAHARHLAGSSLTAVNLAGLTRVELGFALVLAAAAAGLVLALGQAERRRALAVIAGLGARPRQLGAFVRGEAIVVTAVGTCLGAAAGYGLALALVKVLTGVFDPPPSVIAFPWVYLAGVVAAAVIASTLAAETALRLGRRHPATLLRDV
jgi:putative ABC transport system permease protein